MDTYDRIRTARKVLGMTQTDLAKKCGYADKSMIARVENGQVDIHLSKLKMIAKALGVSAEYLFGVAPNQDQIDRVMVYAADMKSSHYLADVYTNIRKLDDIDLLRIKERIDTMLEADKYKDKE